MKKIVIANWKMNTDIEQIAAWINKFSTFKIPDAIEIVVAPSFLHLKQTRDILNSVGLSKINLAAQAVSEFESGAHTSQVSAGQLKGICEYAIVGHSETKTTNEAKMKMAANCFQNQLTPIVCYTNLLEVSHELARYEYVAWEDPSNISQNGVYNPKDPQEISAALSNYPNKIIYGGSVNEKNISELAKIEKIAGFLVGNASLNPETFYAIIENC